MNGALSIFPISILCPYENKGEKRADDNLDVLKKRLKEYVEQTEPLISYYSNHKNYIVINGMNDISKVSEDIKNNLNKLK